MLEEESSEVMEAYAAEYCLDDSCVPRSYRKKALHLIDGLRQLKRDRSSDPKEKLRRINFLDQRVRELSVFHRLDHEGSERLIAHLRSGLETLQASGKEDLKL